MLRLLCCLLWSLQSLGAWAEEARAGCNYTHLAPLRTTTGYRTIIQLKADGTEQSWSWIVCAEQCALNPTCARWSMPSSFDGAPCRLLKRLAPTSKEAPAQVAAKYLTCVHAHVHPFCPDPAA